MVTAAVAVVATVQVKLLEAEAANTQAAATERGRYTVLKRDVPQKVRLACLNEA